MLSLLLLLLPLLCLIGYRNICTPLPSSVFWSTRSAVSDGIDGGREVVREGGPTGDSLRLVDRQTREEEGETTVE